MTHHVLTIPARFISSCNRFSSNTCVSFSSITITTPVSFVLRMLCSNFFTLSVTLLVERFTSLWSAFFLSITNHFFQQPLQTLETSQFLRCKGIPDLPLNRQGLHHPVLGLLWRALPFCIFQLLP